MKFAQIKLYGKKCWEMLLNAFTYFLKPLKSRAIQRIAESLIIGLVSGFLVVYIISGPKFSITGLNAKKKNTSDSVDIRVSFRNIGDSAARYVRINHLWAVEDVASAGLMSKSYVRDNIEPGDGYNYTIRDVRHFNKHAYLWLKIEYSDINPLRQFLTTLIGRPYKKTRWARFNPTRGKFETIPGDELDELDKYKKLVNRIDDLSFEEIHGKRISPIRVE